MKKTIVLLAAIICTVSAFAGIKVTSGNVNVLKDANNVASIVFDYSNTIVEGKPLNEYLQGRGDDFVRDWPQESEECEAAFVKRWNKKNKEGMQVNYNTSSPYKLVVKVKKLHMGSFAASFVVGFGAGGCKMDCVIEIYENGNETPALSIDVKEQTGKSEMTEQTRRTSLYMELADDVLGTIKKTK